MNQSTSVPKLSIDIDTLEQLINGNYQLDLNKFSSSDLLKNALNQKSTIDIKSLLPTLNLNELGGTPKIPSSVESSYAFNNPHTRPIHTLPKSIDEFKDAFPNFRPPEQTSIVPPLSSLNAKRTLHEDTKKELSPVEKLLDQNFKAMHLTIQQALSAARSARLNFEDNLLNGPIHPYQKLIHQYLGADFIAPSVNDIVLPENFCPIQSTEHLTKIKDDLFKNTVTQFQHLTAGIGKVENQDEQELMEGLGHAFSTLSATNKGMKFVIDTKKTAEYLEFAEMVRNIPIRDMVTNPVQIAQKVVTRMIEVLAPSKAGAVFVEQPANMQKANQPIDQQSSSKELNEATNSEFKPLDIKREETSVIANGS